MKKLDIKKLGRALKVVLAIGAVLFAGLYLYYAPRLNRCTTARILFHPPDRRPNEPIEIAGIIGKHYSIQASDRGKTADKDRVVLDSIFFQLDRNKERGVILYSQGEGTSINYLCDPF